MRKITGKSLIRIISCLAVAMMVLVGCGAKEQTAVCTLEDSTSGLVTQMVLDAKGDKITKLTQTNTVPLDGFPEEQKAALEESIKDIQAQYNAIEGTKYSFDATDTELKETIEIEVGNKETLKAVAEKVCFRLKAVQNFYPLRPQKISWPSWAGP
ncbi:MAG: DUF1307 domain-containing protein [Muricomes sp.]